MACQSAVRKKVPTSLGKLRSPGTPVRVTRSVSRARSETVDSEEADVRGEGPKMSGAKKKPKSY